MQLLIETSKVQFRVSGPVKPRPDFKDKERQATTRDGEPIWTVRLDAIEPERETKEIIWVEVAGALRLGRGSSARVLPVSAAVSSAAGQHIRWLKPLYINGSSQFARTP